jgi:hypothetical protein
LACCKDEEKERFCCAAKMQPFDGTASQWAISETAESELLKKIFYSAT